MYYAYFGKAVLHIAFYIVILSMLLQFLGYFREKKMLPKFACISFVIAAGLVVLSYLSYLMCFLTGAYDIASVHANSSDNLSFFMKISASWASANGSFLLFTMILAVTSAIQFFVKEELTRKYSLLILSAFSAFFIFIILFLGYDPFAPIDSRNIENGLKNVLMQEMAVGEGEYLNKVELIESYKSSKISYTLDQKAKMIVEYEHANGRSVFSKGRGLRPILRNVYNIFHPICIYLGFIFLFPVFAMLISYLIQRTPTIIWNLRRIRFWLLSSFIFLCAGNALGGLWAYEVLGWGGFWGWDPVENASLIPCLLTLAALHSAWNVNRKGNFKNSLMFSSMLAFFASIWAIWVTRSGAAQSVHDYAGGATTISHVLIGFLMVTLESTLVLTLISQIRNRRAHRTEKFKKTGLNDYFIFFNLTIFILTAIIFILSYRSVFMKWWGLNEVKDTAFFITAPFFIVMFVLMTISTIKFFRVKRFRLAIVITSVFIIGFLYLQFTDSPFGLFTLLKSKTVVEAMILRLTPIALFALFVFNLVVSLQLTWKLLFQKFTKGNVLTRLSSIGFHLGTLMFAAGIATSALMSYPTVNKKDMHGQPIVEKIRLGTNETMINTRFPAYLYPKYRIMAYEVGFALDPAEYENTYQTETIDTDRFQIVNDREFPLAYFYNADEKYIQHTSFLDVFARDSEKTQRMDVKNTQTQNAHLYAFFNLDWSEDKKRFIFDRNFRHFQDVLKGRYENFDYLYYRYWVRVETALNAAFLMPLEMKSFIGFEESLYPEVTIKDCGIADLYLAPESLPDENGEVAVTLQIKPVMILVRVGLFVVLISSILLILTFFKREK